MRLYHFTSTMHLPVIVETGFLKPSDSSLNANAPVTYRNFETGEMYMEGEPTGQQVVWLLDIDVPDGAQHGLQLGAVDKSQVRITVEVNDARRWLDWIKARKHDPKWVESLIRSGGGKSAAKHWWVVPRPIPATEWRGIAVRDDSDVGLEGPA